MLKEFARRIENIVNDVLFSETIANDIYEKINAGYWMTYISMCRIVVK